MSSATSSAAAEANSADASALSMRAALTSPPSTGHLLAASALLVWLCRNRYLRAPWYYQTPHFLACATASFGTGYLLDVYKRSRLRLRAAYVEDFKRTHPDLYPETRRLRWGEVLDPWSPRR